VFGAFLIGAAIGMFAVGVQIPVECSGLIGETCKVLQWSSQWAMRSATAGAGLFGVAFASEWYLEDDSVSEKT
jgi:hypothetical protein